MYIGVNTRITGVHRTNNALKREPLELELRCIYDNKRCLKGVQRV